MASKSDIHLVRSLHSRKGRNDNGLFLVEGPKMVAEALASGFATERIFATDDFADTPDAQCVSPKELERMSALKTPQGILALVRIPHYEAPQKPGGTLMLALDDIQDPGNLGTIIRTADWFGIRDILCSPATADRFNPKVVQATMGALFRVRVHYGPLGELLADPAGPVYGTMLDGENIYTARIDNPATGVVVMGNEGNGIGPAATSLVTRRLHIPPYPAGFASSESLNVSVAAAIVCSEFRRRI